MKKRAVADPKRVDYCTLRGNARLYGSRTRGQRSANKFGIST